MNTDQTYMKTMPVGRLIFSMSLPMILSMMVNSLYNIVDSFFVAKISEKAMTALSLVFPVQNLVNAVCIGFGIGLNAVIAFYLGAQKQEKANAAATQGVLLAILHGIVLMIASIAVMPAFLRAFTSDEEILQLGLAYSNVVFSFAVIVSLGMVFEKLFQAVGRMKFSMFSMICGCVANIILDPMMIFGIGPFPAMGIEGAALATGLGQVLTLLIYVILYFLRPISVRIRIRACLRRGDKESWDHGLSARLYAIGIPAVLNLALPSLLISALNAILAVYSETYVLVLGIYYKLQTFLYLSANGLIQGIRPLVGYNYGAGEYERVKKIFSLSLVVTAVIMAVGTVLCLLIPGTLMGLFTTAGSTIEIGARALRIISAGFVVSSVSIVASGTLEGLSKGIPSLIISLCRYLIVIIPAAFLLCSAFGPDGAWHAFWITECVSCVISWLLYKRTIQNR